MFNLFSMNLIIKCIFQLQGESDEDDDSDGDMNEDFLTDWNLRKCNVDIQMESFCSLDL